MFESQLGESQTQTPQPLGKTTYKGYPTMGRFKASSTPKPRHTRDGQDPGDQRWRETSQFHITTTDESDSDTERNSVAEIQMMQDHLAQRTLELEEMKREKQKALEEKQKAEQELEKALKELRTAKISPSKNERAEEEEEERPTPLLKPPTLRSAQQDHVEYTRGFLATKEKSATSTPGTDTMLANQLERDLHLTDLATSIRGPTYYAPASETKMQFLTPAKKVVKDHRETVHNQKEKMTDIITKIKLLETNNNFGQFNKDIHQEEEKYRRIKQTYIEQKQELMRVEQIAERYQPTLESPKYQMPPEDYRRHHSTMSMKNITNNVPKFDPDDEKNNKFNHTWQAILQYGRLEYFNEEEYKHALSSVLMGSALDTYQEMARQGHTLRHMLDTFADLYAPRNTIEEDQREVDNFTRKANEPIRTTMTRFSCLVDKIRCLSNPISWPDIKYKMCKSVLKQVISIKTRQFLDYEETKIKKVGGQFEMKELIELVNDYETSHDEIPTEDTAIVYCEASGEPAKWANDLQFRQKAIKHNKHMHEHTKQLAIIIGQATTQVAASFIKGPQQKNKLKTEAALHKTQKPQRSLSASSYMSNRSDREDTDVEMTDTEKRDRPKRVNKDYRADDRDRGRSGYNQKARDQTSQRNRERSYSNQSRSYSNQGRPREGQRRPYSKERQGTSYSKGSPQRATSRDRPRSNSGVRTVTAKTNIEEKEGKIVFNNQAYYNCTCSSLHMLGQQCPKSGMPVYVKN